MPFVVYVNSYLTGVYVGYVIWFIAIIVSVLNLLNKYSTNRLPKYLRLYLMLVVYNILISYIQGLVKKNISVFWNK